MREIAAVTNFEIEASYDRSLVQMEDNIRMAQLHLQRLNPIHDMLNHRSRLLPPELQPGYHRGLPIYIPPRLDLEHELEQIVPPPRRIRRPNRLALTDAPVPPLSLPAGSSNDFAEIPVPTTPPRSPRAEVYINKKSGLRKKLLELCKQYDINNCWGMKNTSMIRKLKAIGVPTPYT